MRNTKQFQVHLKTTHMINLCIGAGQPAWGMLMSQKSFFADAIAAISSDGMKL